MTSVFLCSSARTLARVSPDLAERIALLPMRLLFATAWATPARLLLECVAVGRTRHRVGCRRDSSIDPSGNQLAG